MGDPEFKIGDLIKRENVKSSAQIIPSTEDDATALRNDGQELQAEYLRTHRETRDRGSQRRERFHSQGRTYRTHSYVSILAQRKAAGLEWVSRDKSRRFVQRDGSPMPG